MTDFQLVDSIPSVRRDRVKTFHCNEDFGNGSSDDVGNDSYDINDQVLELEQRKDANLTELEALRHQVNCIIINLTLNVNMSATLRKYNIVSCW